MKKHHTLFLATILATIFTPQIFAQKVTISPLPQKITWGEKAFANNQPITIKGDKTADADAVAIRAKLPQPLADLIAHPDERAGALFQEQAGGGERNTLAGTEKELRAQILLQRTDLMQNGAGRQKEEIRGLGEAAAVADG